MLLTIGTTYYNNPDYLLKFVKRNVDYVDELIIVDDGSSLPATDYLSPTKKIRIFKVLKDYGFNSHGCRNLIMTQTKSKWNILMDVDREFIFVDIAYSEIRRKLKENNIYHFMAHASMKESHISVNDYLIDKDLFFKAGGYDEELIGYRDGDRQFQAQLANFGGKKILYGVDMLLTRKSSYALKDGKAKSSKDKGSIPDSLKNLLKQRIKKPVPNKKILTFEWKEIF